MAKKEKELLEDGAKLVSEMSGLLGQMFERLYARAGDAWQFRPKVEELQARTQEFIDGVYPSKEAPPEQEPTVGPEGDEEMEIPE